MTVWADRSSWRLIRELGDLEHWPLGKPDLQSGTDRKNVVMETCPKISDRSDSENFEQHSFYYAPDRQNMLGKRQRSSENAIDTQMRIPSPSERVSVHLLTSLWVFGSYFLVKRGRKILVPYKDTDKPILWANDAMDFQHIRQATESDYFFVRNFCAANANSSQGYLPWVYDPLELLEILDSGSCGDLDVYFVLRNGLSAGSISSYCTLSVPTAKSLQQLVEGSLSQLGLEFLQAPSPETSGTEYMHRLVSDQFKWHSSSEKMPFDVELVQISHKSLPRFLISMAKGLYSGWFEEPCKFYRYPTLEFLLGSGSSAVPDGSKSYLDIREDMMAKLEQIIDKSLIDISRSQGFNQSAGDCKFNLVCDALSHWYALKLSGCNFKVVETNGDTLREVRELSKTTLSVVENSMTAMSRRIEQLESFVSVHLRRTLEAHPVSAPVTTINSHKPLDFKPLNKIPIQTAGKKSSQSASATKPTKCSPYLPFTPPDGYFTSGVPGPDVFGVMSSVGPQRSGPIQGMHISDTPSSHKPQPALTQSQLIRIGNLNQLPPEPSIQGVMSAGQVEDPYYDIFGDIGETGVHIPAEELLSFVSSSAFDCLDDLGI